MALHNSDDKIDGFREFEVESAMDTLTRSEEIKKDKKMMKAVAKFAKRKIKAITSIKQLKEVAKNFGSDHAKSV